MEMGGGGNIVEGPRQYLQGPLARSVVVGGSVSETSASAASAAAGAAPNNTANTCNNLSLDDARPVSMETTPNPLPPYWPPRPPPSSEPDSPLTNSSKDARDGTERLQKADLHQEHQRHRFDHSYPPGDSLQTKNWVDSGPGHFLDTDSPIFSRTHHNLPPIAAITSTHNYRGVREAHHKHKTDRPSHGTPPDRPPETEADEDKYEAKTGADASDFAFARPSAVHSHASSGSKASAPALPRAPTPFVVADHRPYRPLPEAQTLNATAATANSASNSASPSPSLGVAPLPHYSGSAPAPSRLPLPANASSPSSPCPSPRLIPSPHSSAPSPSPLSRHRTSPQADATPGRSPLPPSDSMRYSPAVPYPNYPYLSSSRPSSKPVPSPPAVIPTRGLPSRSTCLSDAHCRNPFEMPASRAPHYPQQPPQQPPPSPYGQYAHAKPTTYYPYAKPVEKDCDGFKRVQQQQTVVPSKGPYPMEGPRYDRQHQPVRSLSRSSPMQHESKSEEAGRQWTRTTDTSGQDTWSYTYNVHARPGPDKINQTYPDNARGHPGSLAYRDAQSVTPCSGQPNGSAFPVVASLHHSETTSSSKTATLGHRFPPVPQSNYDLNREIYDRMTGGNQRQPHRFPSQPNHHRPPERATLQMAKPQLGKPHPYYRDSPRLPASDKDKYHQADASRPYARRDYASEDPGTVVVDACSERNEPRPYPAVEPPRVHQERDFRHRELRPTATQGGYPVLDRHQPGEEATLTREYDANAQSIDKAAKAPRAVPNIATRPKRESPLDLSVKTVRQSADSTAKDDGDMYPHSFRGPVPSENRYQISSNGPTASAPKIDFNPDFSGFHVEARPKTEAAAPSALPPVDTFKKSAGTPGDHRSDAAQSESHQFEQNADHLHRQYRFQQERLKYPFPEKRPSTEPLGSRSSLPKLPKIDAWRLAMDQQIEQRLNSARPPQKPSSTAEAAATSLVDSSGTVMTATATTTTASASDRCRNAAHPKPPVQTSAAPYDPSSYLRRPQCRPTTPQTPHDRVPRRDGLGHSPDPEQIIKQISEGVMPDRKLLQDKNVVSILRSSLEEKEAKLIQLREAARRKERLKEQQQDSGKKCTPNNDQAQRLGFPDGKQTLPPFGAIALDRASAQAPYPARKGDAGAEAEHGRSYSSPAVKQEPEKSGIPSLDPSPQDDAQGPPTDLDGLAAFLAARIRTKAELKQVGPTLDNLRALSSRRSPEASAGVVNGTQTPSQSSTPSASSTTVSPPKLQRESRLHPPFRRRLFSHAEDEVSGAAVSSAGDVTAEGRPMPTELPSREPGSIRSSSETSVFDFRESDSEGEMPVLERQTLEGMRRDRRTLSSKQSVSTTTPDDPVEAKGPKSAEPERIAELDACEPDPFWNAAFDMFVEQLEKRPPKRSVRRKAPRWRSCTTNSESSARREGDEADATSVDPGTSDAVSGNDAIDGEKGPKEEEEEEMLRDSTGNRSGVDAEERTRDMKEEVRQTVKVEPQVKVELEEEDVKMRQVDEETEGEEEERAGATVAAPRPEDSAKGEKSEATKQRRRREAAAERGSSGRVTRANRHAEEGPPASRLDCDLDSQAHLKSDSSFPSSSASSEDEDEDDDDDDSSVSVGEMESESTESGDTADDNSNADSDSDEDESNEDSDSGRNRRLRMRTRMQTRTSRQLRNTGMRLRSKAVPAPKGGKVPRKSEKKKRRRLRRRRRKRRKEQEGGDGEEVAAAGERRKKKRRRKKPSFGDGSYFRPGWEEECYKFKQQLRMPEKLISISRPPKRSAASLPDLDPYRNSPSMSLDSFDVSLSKKMESENDGEESESRNRHKAKKGGGGGVGSSFSVRGSEQASDGAAAPPSLLTLRNGKKSRADSILNLLVNKYGRLSRRKHGSVSKAISERKSPRILPKGSDKPELLPTPSLGIGKENVLKDRKKGSRDLTKRKADETESIYLGYFRRKTVNNFKEAFKEKGGLLPDEFGPEILESRTRMQTKVLKKRATLVEVFGEERPASAPPLSRGAGREAASDGEKPAEKKKAPRQTATAPERPPPGVVTRGKGSAARCGRPGLRSAAVLRSNKAVQISKRHLNNGRRQRNIELIRLRAMASEKLRPESSEKDRPTEMACARKRLKLRSARRKFRSGFDYIRKKKKMKRDGDSVDGSVKEKKAVAPRANSESIADIQSEMKNWVINKGLGETVLHRAARLGYTDVAAYCLEKMDCSPSPRDNAGYTPLHEACSRGHLDIAKLLLMYGASVSESAKGGIRPLHEAAENGFTELIRLLLSYGADPLLETYTGHTALSLVTDEDARRLIQHHLADVQGNVAPPWTFNGPASLFDPAESGFDPLEDPPSPETSSSHEGEFEVEACESWLPPLYRLADDFPEREPWVLVRDVVACAKGKSRDVLVKQLSGSSSREMKASEFAEKAKCCNLLGGIWSGIGSGSSKSNNRVVLVPYDDRVRQLIGVERVLV